MTRTDWLKVGYLIVLVGLATAVGGVVYAAGGEGIAVVAAVVILLIPGRIQGYFYRDLLRGRRLLNEKNYDSSIRHTSRFLELVRERPKLKRLLWLGWSFYTDDVEAMARNNLGAARMESGDWEVAAADFHQVLVLDPRYPTPYFNLALLAEARGNRSEAERLFSEAVVRGFRGTNVDGMIQRGQSLYARIEGRGGDLEKAGESPGASPHENTP